MADGGGVLMRKEKGRCLFIGDEGDGGLAFITNDTRLLSRGYGGRPRQVRTAGMARSVWWATGGAAGQRVRTRRVVRTWGSPTSREARRTDRRSRARLDVRVRRRPMWRSA
jgi:hypothetical protein